MDPEEDNSLDELDGDATQDGDEGSDTSAPPSQAAGGDEASSKRINDLMGKWQAAEARANAAEAKLKAPASKDESADGGAQDAREFLDFAREDARRRIFEQSPKLAAAGLDASSIGGSTLEEMKASFKRQMTFVDGVESRVRAAVLSEHGLDPEVVAGGHEEGKSFASMSDKEFAEFLEARDRRH